MAGASYYYVERTRERKRMLKSSKRSKYFVEKKELKEMEAALRLYAAGGVELVKQLVGSSTPSSAHAMDESM